MGLGLVVRNVSRRQLTSYLSQTASTAGLALLLEASKRVLVDVLLLLSVLNVFSEAAHTSLPALTS